MEFTRQNNNLINLLNLCDSIKISYLYVDFFLIQIFFFTQIPINLS